MLLLETLGSRHVNCTVLTFLVISLTTLLLEIVWFNPSLLKSHEVTENEWYTVLARWYSLKTHMSNTSNLYTLVESEELLKGLLFSKIEEEEGWKIQETGDLGLRPSCHNTSQPYLQFLDSKLNDFSDQLPPNSGIPDDLYSLASKYLSANFQGDQRKPWFIRKIFGTLQLSQYPSSNWRHSYLVQCFNTTSEMSVMAVCDPCGNATAMKVRFSPDLSSWTDLVLGGKTYSTDDIYILQERCLRRIIRRFISPCFLESISQSDNQTKNGFHLLIATPIVEDEVFWDPFSRTLMLLFDYDRASRVLKFCSGKHFNVLEFIGSSHLHNSWKNSTETDLLACWDIYAMYMWTHFLLPQAKHQNCMNTSVFPQDDSLFITAFKEVIAIPKFSFESQNTTFADGFPILPSFAENTRYRSYDRDYIPYATVGELWEAQQGNQSITTLFSPEMVSNVKCTSFISTAPQELDKFLSALRTLEVGYGLRYNLNVIGVGVVILFGVSLAWFGIFMGHLAMTKASKLFAISTTMFSVLVVGCVPLLVRTFQYFASEYQSLILDLYFSGDRRFEEGLGDSVTVSVFLSTFFLFHVVTDSHIVFRRRPEWWYFLFAAIYFITRGAVCPFALHANIGVVPFVNWISVFQICNLEGITPFPYCYRESVVGSPYVAGNLPFIGICVGGLADFSAVLLASFHSRKCHGELQSKGFQSSRQDILAMKLKSLLINVLLLSVFIRGILSAATAVPAIIFDGAFSYGSYGVESSISLQITGIQGPSVGTYTDVLFFCWLWSLLLLPVESGLGKILAGKIKRPRIGFQVAETTANNDLCLESLIRAICISHSSYYLQQDRKSFPREFQELCLVLNDKTDTLVWLLAWKDTIYISFRGTVSGQNAKTDLNIKKSKLNWSHFQNPKNGRHDKLIDVANLHTDNCRVHKGFLKSITSVIDSILDILNDRPEIKKFVCTGHSLGGALATLLGLFLATCSKYYQVQVYTFGSPKVGDSNFARLFDKSVKQCFRVVQRGDPVTKTPFSIPFPSCIHSGGYMHVGIAIISELHGDLIIDPSVLDLSVLHHWKLSGRIMHHSSNTYLISMFAFVARRYKNHFVFPIFESVKDTVLNRSDQYYSRNPSLYSSIQSLFINENKL